jgi:hypothetical protein
MDPGSPGRERLGPTLLVSSGHRIVAAAELAVALETVEIEVNWLAELAAWLRLPDQERGPFGVKSRRT